MELHQLLFKRIKDETDKALSERVQNWMRKRIDEKLSENFWTKPLNEGHAVAGIRVIYDGPKATGFTVSEILSIDLEAEGAPE